MKLQDLTFEILSAHGITKLPTTTDASRVVTSKLGFEMWKQEFKDYWNSEVRFVDRGAIWGGLAVIVESMEDALNKYISLKAEALS